jgi:hypothetical protein
MKWLSLQWDRLCWFLYELIKTLSSEKSWLSSKRLERLIIFIAAETQLNRYVHRNIDKLSATDIVMIYSAQMVYAGFIIKQIKDDKTTSNQSNSIPSGNSPANDIV